MKTKEQKAIEIAIKEGWVYNKESECFSKENSDIEVSNGVIIAFYSSYNGLMPIVFRLLGYIDLCYELCNTDNRWVCVSTKKYGKPLVDIYYKTESEFLDALLDAVHFVLCGDKEKKE